MTGMRNRIAHGYFELDLEIVRDTVQARLPELIVLVTPIREQLSRDDLIRDARDE
jgi:uncharacterized protein with HEPN domain